MNKTAKKIAILYSGSNNWGGIETYLTNLFKYADKSKVELVLLSLGKWELSRKCQMSNVKCQMFSAKRVRIRTIFEIARYLKENKIDLIVSQGVVANAYARAASLFSGIPSLVTVHSAFELDYHNPVIRFLYFLSDRVSRWKTKKYITVSEFLKNSLRRSGISEQKIEVIYNGVSFSVIPTEVEESKGISSFDSAQDKLARNDNTLTIGSIGRLHKVKGYENLIKAMSLIEIPNAHLIIWGEGTEKQNLKQIIKKNNLEDRVSLPGQTDSVERALSGVSIYAQPSFSEGFSITVVEAMSAGLPVVVTPFGALPELVEDGKTGIIAESGKPEDLAAAIKKLAQDKVYAESLGEKARVSVRERFDVRDWIKKTINNYLETIK